MDYAYEIGPATGLGRRKTIEFLSRVLRFWFEGQGGTTTNIFGQKKSTGNLRELLLTGFGCTELKT
jgi:hypothetical protein